MDDRRPSLEGFRALLIKDGLDALDVRKVLEDTGLAVLGPIAYVRNAWDTLAQQREFDIAVLGIQLVDGFVFEIAEEIRRREIPIVFVTRHPVDTFRARVAQEEVVIVTAEAMDRATEITDAVYRALEDIVG